MTRWMQPLLDDIDKLAANYDVHQARLTVVQHELIKLINILDPEGDRIPIDVRERM